MRDANETVAGGNDNVNDNGMNEPRENNQVHTKDGQVDRVSAFCSLLPVRPSIHSISSPSPHTK